MSAELGQVGQIIDGKYRIVRILGSGGMGAVFEGENTRIRRKVAIKMLHAGVSDQPEVIARFEREAQAAALVGSEHICEVLDLGVLPDQTRYMVMEYLEGDTLSGLIKKNGRLAPVQSIPIMTQILDALGAAHAAGIIHRDLKPDNVFILPQKGGVQNFVKILDFGVSKFSQTGGEAMNMTRAGAVVGTPYYMSPEQARGSSGIDARTDIYAIGVVLYQATTGQVPYQAETFNELLFKIVLEVAPPPQVYAPDIDPDFAAIIQRAMSREPGERFQSCQQFREALVQFQMARQNPHLAAAFREPPTARTEMLDMSKLPPLPTAAANQGRSVGSSGQYPAVGPAAGAPYPAAPMGAGPVPPASGLYPGVGPAPGEGTMPMQPGLQLGASGLGQHQSGSSWAAVPMGSTGGAIPVGPSGPTTSNAWGNASSSSNVIAEPKPKSGKGMVFAVVGVAALLGVGVAIAAVVMMGKPTTKGSAAQPTATPTAAEVTSPVPPPVTVTASVAPTTTAPATATTPTATPNEADTATAPANSGTPATHDTAKPKTPGPMPTATGTATKTSGGTHTGTTTKTGGKKTGGSGDLGY
jgi:serine/threonine-protein kinase